MSSPEHCSDTDNDWCIDLETVNNIALTSQDSNVWKAFWKFVSIFCSESSLVFALQSNSYQCFKAFQTICMTLNGGSPIFHVFAICLIEWFGSCFISTAWGYETQTLFGVSCFRYLVTYIRAISKSCNGDLYNIDEIVVWKLRVISSTWEVKCPSKGKFSENIILFTLA